MPDDSARRDDLQPSGVPVARVVLVSLASLALIGVVLAGSAGLYRGETTKGRVSTSTDFPAPRIMQNQAVERKQLYADQRQRLASYRWIDRTDGIVGIPIQRAMELVAESGSKGYAPIGEKATAPQAQAAAPPTTAQQPTIVQRKTVVSKQKPAVQKPPPTRGRHRGVRNRVKSRPRHVSGLPRSWG